MPEKKKLQLSDGRFSRENTPDEEPVTTREQMLERAAACLEEAARSQHPNNQSYIRQAEIWMQMAEATESKGAPT